MKKYGMLVLVGCAFIANANELLGETYYVNANVLNVRNAPMVGEVIDTLGRGEQVLVYAKEQNWANISDDPNAPKWVATQFLCNAENCYQVYIQPTSPTKASSKPSQNYNTPIYYTPTPSVRPSYGGACPCSGSYRCTGPRGGKYCYTSSGKKSYR